MDINYKKYSAIAAALFDVIGLLHALRLIYGWPAKIGGAVIPYWASWVALILSGFLSFQGFRIARSGTQV